MSQRKFFVKSKRVGWILAMMAATGTAVAEESWVAPAPMGPYGGHFDFGVPAEAAQSDANNPLPQAEFAMYRQQEQLPVMQASYSTNPAEFTERGIPDFGEEDLRLIDPAWSLEGGAMGADPAGMESLSMEHDSYEQPLGVNGMTQPESDVWALGEIRPEKLPQLLEQTAQPVVESAAAMVPCTVNDSADHQQVSSSQTPFQEVMLDDFETAELDMDAMAREAEQFSNTEEFRSRRWAEERPAPVFYPTFMPDYALGVRRANAMDPLALIPQMRSPVQYFGFQR